MEGLRLRRQIADETANPSQNHDEKRGLKPLARRDPVQQIARAVHPRQASVALDRRDSQAILKASPAIQPGLLNRGLELRLVPREVKSLMVMSLLNSLQQK